MKRTIQTFSNGDTRLTLYRRVYDLYDVYLQAEDTMTGQEATRRFTAYNDGSKAFRIAMSGVKGHGDDVRALCGLTGGEHCPGCRRNVEIGITGLCEMCHYASQIEEGTP